MISDNATTFYAAATHIERLCSSPTIQAALTDKGTKWQFIPQRAPWYGGWWERLVGVMKTTIKKVLGKASVDFQTLQTVITEVEAIMNDRPITYVTSSRDDPEPLTPAHLLHGRRLTGLPYSDAKAVGDSSFPNVTRRDITQRALAHARLIEQYRHRWTHEYLTSLREFLTKGCNNH